MTLWWFEVAAAHERPLKRLFLAPRCSCAYLFCLLTISIAILLPFFAAFGAGGFWLKMQVYHETPEVRFGHEYLLMLEGNTAESNKVWSSQADINDALGATTPPIARYTPIDLDNDGRPDNIKLQFSMPISDRLDATVTRAVLYSVFKYTLADQVKMVMQGLGAVDISNPRGATSGTVFTRLRFDQEDPLGISNVQRKLYDNNPLAYSWLADKEPFSMQKLVETYSARNETISLDTIGTPIWDYQPSNKFDLTVNIKVPTHRIEYVATTTELLKSAWIQYLAFFIPIWLLLACAKDFIYGAQLLPTRVAFEGPPRKLTHLD